MVSRIEVRKDTYRDSITLLRISNELARLEGVTQATTVLGTALNKRLLKDVGFAGLDLDSAGTDDLIIALEASSQDFLEAAFNKVDYLLLSKESVAETEVLPKTIDAALQAMPDANMVIISIPGRFAKREALTAIRRGLHVFLFSSDIPSEDEVELKTIAREKGLLMMGPDCGTAIINRVALGFGNAIREGTIGIVSAAGTGLQQVSSLIHEEGLGVSQAIGTGGNDLSEKVGGIMTVEGLKLLESDEKTKAIILISKPPNPQVGEKVLNVASSCKKPVIVSFIGEDVNKVTRTGCTGAANLEDAAKIACSLVKGIKFEQRAFTLSKEEITSVVNAERGKLSSEQKYIRGLYSGGSLCYESLTIQSPLIGGVHSNVPLKSEFRLRDANVSLGHTCVDMGTEEFTLGRAHPMIDFRLRKRRIVQEARDPETAVVLLDVVLGYGANQDPAGELAQSISEAKKIAEQDGRYLSVVGSIIGTPGDPQDFQKQKSELEKVGVIVMPSNTQAARIATLIAVGPALENKVFG